MKSSDWTKVVVPAYVVADFSKPKDQKGEARRFLRVILPDKTSGDLGVGNNVTTDNLAGTKVRLTILKKDEVCRLFTVETESPPEFITEIPISTLGIFPRKR